MRNTGFTLAEVLIALALLGVVAAFAIPKILQSSEDSRKIAVMKEAIGAMNDIAYQAGLKQDIRRRLQPYLDSEDNVTNLPEFKRALVGYFGEKLNALKVCPNNALNEGCWPGPATPEADNPNTPDAPAIVLPNGVYLTDFEANDTWAPYGDTIYIDYNGTKGPNAIGEDQIGVLEVWMDRSANNTKAGRSFCSALSEPYHTRNQTLCKQVYGQ